MTLLRNSTNSTDGAKTVLDHVAATSRTDKLTPGKTYYYFLRSYAADGTASAYEALPVLAAKFKGTALSGVVLAATGKPAVGGNVELYRGSLKVGGLSTTDGVFTRAGVPYAAAGLSVCLRDDDLEVSPGSLPTCWLGAPYDAPQNATRLTFATGEYRALHVQLAPAGGIHLSQVDPEGTSVDVGTPQVFDADGVQVQGSFQYDGGGAYLVTGLKPGGYTVLFPGGIGDPAHPRGLAGQWYGGARPQDYWPGSRPPATGVTTVAVVGGQVTDVPVVTLRAGGEVAARLTGGDTVLLYDVHGKQVVYGLGGNVDQFGVTPGSYTLCATDSSGQSAPACWSPKGAVAWDGNSTHLPAAARNKILAVADKQRSVRLTLSPLSRIVGSVNYDGGWDVRIYDANGRAVGGWNLSTDPGGFAYAELPGAYTVCAYTMLPPAGDPGPGACWNGTTGQQEAWGGPASDFPAATVGSVHLETTDYTGIAFNLSGIPTADRIAAHR